MRLRQFLGNVLVVKEISSIFMLTVTILIFYILSPYFLSYFNLRTLLELFPELGIVVLGVTVLMISGEFDLSVGSVFALCPILIVKMLSAGVNLGIATTLALIVSLGIGALNALMVVKTGIPSFIITLATMMCWRGVVLAVTEGTPPSIPEEFSWLESHLTFWLGPIRISFIYFLAKVKLISFMITSLLAGFAGLVQTSRIGSALPSAGQGWELDAIAASVIGGTSLFGGAGSIIGAAIGAFLLRIIGNGLVIAGAPGYYFRMFVGIIIILAVIFDITLKKRASKARW